MLSDEKRKELLAKKEYYREHPEEVLEEILKRDDGIGMIIVDSSPNEKPDYKPEIIDGEEYYSINSYKQQQKHRNVCWILKSKSFSINPILLQTITSRFV